MKQGIGLILCICACARSSPPPEYQGMIELHERVLAFEVPGRLKELLR